MDNTKYTPTVLSFCSGYDGIGLGLEQAIGRIRTIAHVEIESFAIANLVDKMETGRMVPAPVWTDVKTFPGKQFYGKVDIITAGYPCQPFSAAGKRIGKEDPRHLWPFIRKAVNDIRPAMCFFENVEGHVTLGLSTVLSDLEEDGYTTSWGLFSASEVGAPHQRKRVFILGVSNTKGNGLQRVLHENINTKRRKRQVGHAGGSLQVWPSRPGQEQFEWEPPRLI